jgi:LacI family gluconate utilization system Gnt-I transcriptional repressor
MHNAFFSATLEALASELETRDLSLLVGNSSYEAEMEYRLVRSFLSWRPRALILTGISHPARLRRIVTSAGIPVIEMWELSRNPITLSVGFSHRKVGARLARHLAGNGYRRLGFTGANMKNDLRARKRCEGFVAEVQALGLAPATVVHIESRADVSAGREAAAQLLNARPRIEGAAFSNDILALGALFECQAQGISIPQGLAIAGFGNLDSVASAYPPITSIAPPSREIGRLVAQAIFDESIRSRRSIDLGFELIERDSTRPK